MTTTKKTTCLDLEFANHGSIWLMRPITIAGRAWIQENIEDGATWLGGACAIERRYVEGIAAGAISDGLEVGL